MPAANEAEKAAKLANEVISFEGKYYKFSNLRLLPRPLQMPR